MPKELEPSTNEKNFILEALKQKLRLDGRNFDSFRPLELSFGHEYGHADVRLGNTRVLCRVSADVVPPFSDRPFDGIFTITTELGPMASPAFETGRQTEQEVLLARLIEKSLRRSRAIDTESLCIVAGQRCWHVRADVHFLNHDGGLVDAACIAVVAALQHFRRPDVSVDGERVTIHTLTERVPVPLSILHVPICVTFSFFDVGDESGGPVFLVDATLQEEQLRDGEMTITLNKFGEVCQIAKAGGLPIEAVALHQCMRKALVKVEEITAFIAKRLKECS
ncbi:ribosomal protein S5 domain 2-type protein [Sphaerosporella brunnea]|uniref:Exosome complex component RRP45 n=1 Tax=Sphaerosporella brunnea TaxID=1250544 RepID=A0A5J5F227_9PEZI|nr:ribosomal protein S5 domain 2-type protein [Sphaerosporella brunnea]